jgi:MFS family permease
VIVLGWVSFFTDASADMVYPLVPAFLVSLGGGATALGWLEGVAEAVSAGIKLWAGRAIDRTARPKRFVVAGYGISALARPLYALASAPIHAVLVRVADRVGKGMRGPPRDAMLAAAVDEARRGHAFGFHRMMDNFGGVAGPLLAFLLLRLAELPLRALFLASVVPGLASVLIAQVFLKEHPEQPAADAAPAGAGAEREPQRDAAEGAPAQEDAAAEEPARARDLPWRFFLVTAVFTLAASGDLFLMRRLTDLGLRIEYVPMAWVSLQLLKGLFNVPGGRASDRHGRRRVLAIAWMLYAATYACFGVVRSWWAAWLLLVPYALHYGLAEGGQRALLAELAPRAARGRAFGAQLAIEGIFILPANVGFGWLLDHRGATTAFTAAAACAALAAVLLVAIVRPGYAGTTRTRSS